MHRGGNGAGASTDKRANYLTRFRGRCRCQEGRCVVPNRFASIRGGARFRAGGCGSGAGTVRARATTENHDRALWAAQFVHVRLILETLKNAMLVPSSAVQIGQNGPYVFVVKSDSTLDLRQVKPGQRQEGDMTVITQGVKPGETVVTRGQLQLTHDWKDDAQDYKETPYTGIS